MRKPYETKYCSCFMGTSMFSKRWKAIRPTASSLPCCTLYGDQQRLRQSHAHHSCDRPYLGPFFTVSHPRGLHSAATVHEYKPSPVCCLHSKGMAAFVSMARPRSNSYWVAEISTLLSRRTYIAISPTAPALPRLSVAATPCASPRCAPLSRRMHGMQLQVVSR